VTPPAFVHVWEAGARDGLQNEPKTVPTAIKIELIERLADCGLKLIEATSFVSPKWVPQMADNAAVLAGLKPRPGVTYQVLTPNMKGFEDAAAAGAKAVGVFAAASETFSRKNINCSIDESIERFRPVCEAAAARGIKVRGFVSCIAGCPYEGKVAPAKVADVARKVLALGCTDVGLGDTIGVGTPRQIEAVIEACARDIPLSKLGVHFHDTYGQALANILAALNLGISIVDGAVAGLGGCPYAPGASGNVATEDVIYMLDGMGIETGVDLKRLVQTAWFIADALGRPPASRVARALKSKCL
jgi:hydroxymethylglutaryl-CoA lyase